MLWLALSYGSFTEDRAFADYRLERAALVSGGYFVLIFVIAVALGRLARQEWTRRFVYLLLAALGVTFAIEWSASGLDSAVTTHVLPLGISVALLLAPLLLGIYVIRIAGVLAAIPWLVPITLLIVVVPLFSQDLWQLAAQATLTTILLLVGVTIVPMLAMVLGQLLIAEFDRIVIAAAADLRTATISPDAEVAGTLDRVIAGIALRDSAGTALGSLVRRGWNRFRGRIAKGPSHERDRKLLKGGYTSPAFDHYVRYTRARLKRTFRAWIGWRTVVLVLGVVMGSAAYIYSIAWIVVPAEQAKDWAGKDNPSTWDSWVGVAMPTGPHLLVVAVTAVIASAIFLALVLTTHEMKTAFQNTASHGPIKRCLAIAVPFAKLSADDTADSLTTIDGASGSQGVVAMGPTKAGIETPGRAALWYRWTSPVTGEVAFDTDCDECESWLAVYADGDAPQMTSRAHPLQCGSGRVRFGATQGDAYIVVVDAFKRNGALERGDVVLRWLANNYFTAAAAIAGRTGSVNGHNRLATAEPQEPHHAGSPPHASVWYRWIAPRDGPATLDTFGSNFNTVLAAYTGKEIGNLAVVDENDDVPDGVSSRIEFDAEEGVEYRIAVDGCGGAMGDLVLNWGPPPNDDLGDAHPIEGRTGQVPGANATATREEDEPDHAARIGGASIWYRWIAPVDGEVTFDTVGSDFDTLLAVYTGSGFSDLNQVAANDDAEDGTLVSRVRFAAEKDQEYLIAVDGFRGATGHVSLNWDYPPVNGRIATAERIHGPAGRREGTNRGATREPGEPDHAGRLGGASLWYRWDAPADGVVTFDTAGSEIDTLLAVYTGTSFDDLEPVAASGDAFGGARRIQVRVSAGSSYLVAIDGYVGATGDVVLNWRYPPPNDDLVAAQMIDGESGTIVGENLGATVEDGEPGHAGRPGGASVWYRWTAPADGKVTFDTAGSDFDTLLAAYTSSGLDDLEELDSNDDADGLGVQSRIAFAVSAGAEYLIAIDGYGGATGSIVLTWRLVVAPENATFKGAVAIQGRTGGVRVETASASREPGEPSHAARPGGASVWYRWSAPSDGEVTFDTIGSDFDTLLAVYTGSSLDTLQEVAANDDDPDIGVLSRVRFHAVQGKQYFVAVDGYAGATGRAALNWALVTAGSGDLT